MAKKKSTKNLGAVDAAFAELTTADLTGDGANPRKISDEAKEGLGHSLEKFGDLSGIVWNMRSGELVAGHQRMAQIREKWGDHDIEVLDLERGLGGVAVDALHFFPVRIVDWSPAKQRAANVTANNQKLQGKFTKELGTYLLEFTADISEELPGVMDGCLLTELAASGMDLSDATEDEGEPEASAPGVDIEESFQVVVTCKDALDQEAVYTQMTEAGYDCRVLAV